MSSSIHWPIGQVGLSTVVNLSSQQLMLFKNATIRHLCTTIGKNKRQIVSKEAKQNLEQIPIHSTPFKFIITVSLISTFLLEFVPR